MRVHASWCTPRSTGESLSQARVCRKVASWCHVVWLATPRPGFETRRCEARELRRAAVRVERSRVLLGSSAAATSCGGSRRNRHVRHLITLPRQRKSDRRWKRLESTRSSTRGRQRSTCSRALLHVALGGSGEAARLQGAVHR